VAMRRWRLLRACVVLTAVPLAVGLAPAPAAHADQGLVVSSVYTYTVDPASSVVRVSAEMSFTNTVPDHTQGNIINKTYFDGFSIPLPIEARAPVGPQNGVGLTERPEFIDGTSTYYRLNVSFSKRLFYKQTAHVVVTYDISSQPPRADAPTRVNGAYA